VKILGGEHGASLASSRNTRAGRMRYTARVQIWTGMGSYEIEKLVLDFGEFSPWNEFNDKYWDIALIHYSKVELFYFNPEYGNITDVLILERL